MIVTCPCGCGITWDDAVKLPGNRRRKWGTRSICRERWVAKNGADRKFRSRPCAQCGEVFIPTTSNRATCSEECAAAKVAGVRYNARHDASRHTRETYCWQWKDGEHVRCQVQIETCGEGCYRAQKGQPVCRVEP